MPTQHDLFFHWTFGGRWPCTNSCDRRSCLYLPLIGAKQLYELPPLLEITIMKKLLYLLAFGLANAFSLNSFSQAVPPASGVTAQLVQTSQGIFYQKDALSWGLNARTLVILRRGTDFITLQDESTMDQYTLALGAGKVMGLKAKTTTPLEIGQITNVAEASGPGLNGVSFLLRSPDRMVHVDADRYFAPAGPTARTAMTSDGSPGQWERKTYTVIGASFSPTKGPTVKRVDLSNGSRFEKSSDGLWREYKSDDKYSWTDEWLRTASNAYVEQKRDEWSVYLVNPATFKAVQIDLYTKKVTWSKGKSDEKNVSILPEKFPFYGQFSRASFDLMDDAVLKTYPTATGATIKTTNSSVTSIDLLKNTCKVSGAGYTSCEVLMGEFAPRGITGYSLGGFSLALVSNYQVNYLDYFDVGMEAGAFKGIFNKIDTANGLEPQVPMNKGRAHVKFTDGLQVSLSEKSATPLIGGYQRQTLTGAQQYFTGQMKGLLPYPDPKLSPGFQIQNRTDHDVLVSLEQVGCLYYGIVKPGQTFYRQTGAVWFTVKAVISPDLKAPTALSCALNPIMMVATVYAAGVSGGTAAVPMAMLSGMVQGAAYATSSYVESKGGTDLEAIAGKTAVLAVGGGLAGGINGLVAMNNQMVPAVGTALAVGGGRALVSVLSQTNLDKMTAELTQSASLFGQYAGYTWPWKTADRVMPIYEITGGPTVTQLKDGGVLYQYQKTPLTIKKTN